MTNFKYSYTYDDVLLEPQYNNISSRNDTTIDLSTWLTTKTRVAHPFIPANMDTVISDEVADLLIKSGSVPLFHRFTTLEQQFKWIEKYPMCFISMGVSKDEENKVYSMIDKGHMKFLIDIAHAHCDYVRDLMKRLLTVEPELELIVGNVCTQMAYQDLVSWGASAVKCGVANGAACSTAVQTGHGMGQFSTVYEIGKTAQKLRVPIICDGGIKYPKDVAKALAAGGSTVMMGSLFCKTFESAAPKYVLNNDKYIKVDNTDLPDDKQIYARYRGQASKEFQEDFYGKMKRGTVPEGVAYYTKCTGPFQNVIDEYSGALRSSFTYSGSRTIKELQRKAEFRFVTRNYLLDSHPRPNQ
jgi:IMP dehydrogenase